MEVFTFKEVKEELFKKYDGLAVTKLTQFIKGRIRTMLGASHRIPIRIVAPGSHFILLMPLKKRIYVVEKMSKFNKKWVYDRNYNKLCK